MSTVSIMMITGSLGASDAHLGRVGVLRPRFLLPAHPAALRWAGLLGPLYLFSSAKL